MLHSFLLIGQSNASGRGDLTEAPPLDNKNGRLKVLRNGRWKDLFRPVNAEKSVSGYCLAESFAMAYAEADPDVEVGIIPCAEGGTQLLEWMPGELLFDHAVACAKLAMRTSKLVGILWHQGESDCAPDLHPHYIERFTTIMDTLRRELGCPEVPILVGGLGDFLTGCGIEEIRENFTIVNDHLKALGQTYPHCAFVPAEGLGANADNLHFSTEALRAFGLRYFEAFRKFQ